MKDKELLRQLEANDLTRQGRACQMLKEEIKLRSDDVRGMIEELKILKASTRR